MGQGSSASTACSACTAAAMILGAAASGHCYKGPVGSCKDYDCLPTYGPTVCVDGQCMCRKDYCSAKMDDTLFSCRACVGTCSILNPCESNHGGSQAVECVDGLCLCHSGFHADEDGICQRGWWPPPFLAEEVNGTGRPAAALAARPGRRPAMRPRAALGPLPALGVAAVCLAACAAACSAAGSVRRRAEKASQEEEGPCYERLPEHQSEVLAAG